MSTILEDLREDLGRRYRELDLEIDKGRKSDPSWLWVSPDTLRADASIQSPTKAAALLDPEVGLIHFFLMYQEGGALEGPIIRSLNIRSQLRQERGLETVDTDHVDLDGAWRIVVVWLVPIHLEHEWTNSISSIRSETGFSEEIAFDAIFYESDSSERAIEAHMFPKLLLTLRHVLKLDTSERALAWMSANNQVQLAFEEFALKFTDPGQKKLAGIIEGWCRAQANAVNNFTFEGSAWGKADHIRIFCIQNFRSIKLLSIDFGKDPSSSVVVCGPNGTGKSSLAEALSIAQFGTSTRHWEFCDPAERDIKSKNRNEIFSSEYLRKIDADVSPNFSIDGKDWRPFTLVSSDDRNMAKLAMESNVLTQELSQALCKYDSSELASRILRGYSDLADQLESLVEIEVKRANDRRQDYLRSLGLSVSITKLTTIQDRIAEKTINGLLLGFSSNIRDWVANLARLPGSPFTRLGESISTWEAPSQVTNLAKALVSASERSKPLGPILSSWAQDFTELVGRVNFAILEVEGYLGQDSEELEALIRKMIVWGTWLENSGQTLQSPITQSESNDLLALEEDRLKLDELRQRRIDLLDHKSHLDTTLRFLASGWRQLHENECPTCGKDLESEGGIWLHINRLASSATNELDSLSARADELRVKFENAQLSVARAGSGENPIPERDRSSIMKRLQWLTPPSRSMEQVLMDVDLRNALIDRVRAVAKVPAKVTLPQNIDELISSMTKELETKFQDAEEKLEEPNNWIGVSKTFQETLKVVVEKHLPETIERLWNEIVASMKSASWINQKPPVMKSEGNRNGKTVRLEVDKRLARYILNQSESHILGTSWFITDYLLRGRYQIPLMVMDDPAQEMDETTFREFSRMIETILRLHRRNGSPLKLLLLFHQETRAVEIAKATASTLVSLQWKQEQGPNVDSMTVVDTSLKPRNPATVLNDAGS